MIQVFSDVMLCLCVNDSLRSASASQTSEMETHVHWKHKKHHLKETASHPRHLNRLTRNSSPVGGNWGINLMTFTTMDTQQHDGWSRTSHKCGYLVITFCKYDL